MSGSNAWAGVDLWSVKLIHRSIRRIQNVPKPYPIAFRNGVPIAFEYRYPSQSPQSEHSKPGRPQFDDGNGDSDNADYSGGPSNDGSDSEDCDGKGDDGNGANLDSCSHANLDGCCDCGDGDGENGIDGCGRGCDGDGENGIDDCGDGDGKHDIYIYSCADGEQVSIVTDRSGDGDGDGENVSDGGGDGCDRKRPLIEQPLSQYRSFGWEAYVAIVQADMDARIEALLAQRQKKQKLC